MDRLETFRDESLVISWERFLVSRKKLVLENPASTTLPTFFSIKILKSIIKINTFRHVSSNIQNHLNLNEELIFYHLNFKACVDDSVWNQLPPKKTRQRSRCHQNLFPSFCVFKCFSKLRAWVCLVIKTIIACLKMALRRKKTLKPNWSHRQLLCKSINI